MRAQSVAFKAERQDARQTQQAQLKLQQRQKRQEQEAANPSLMQSCVKALAGLPHFFRAASSPSPGRSPSQPQSSPGDAALGLLSLSFA